jgi:hypothetical protein
MVWNPLVLNHREKRLHESVADIGLTISGEFQRKWGMIGRFAGFV